MYRRMCFNSTTYYGEHTTTVLEWKNPGSKGNFSGHRPAYQRKKCRTSQEIKIVFYYVNILNHKKCNFCTFSFYYFAPITLTLILKWVSTILGNSVNCRMPLFLL